MDNTLVRDNLNPVELNERSLVALNKIRAFVRTLGDVEQHDKGLIQGSNDYGQGDADQVSSDIAGT
jgi:hypothetical protein